MLAVRWRASSGVNVSWNVVLMRPGETALQRIFRPESSLARPRVSVSTPPLEAA